MPNPLDIFHTPKNRIRSDTLFLCIGLGLLSVALGQGLHQLYLDKTYLRTEAEVLELKPSPGHRGYRGRGKQGTLWAPHIGFRDARGEWFEFTSSIASSPPRYKPGERIWVRYSADNPRQATIDSFVFRWLVPLLLTPMGLVFSLIGALTRWAGKRALARLSEPD